VCRNAPQAFLSLLPLAHWTSIHHCACLGLCSLIKHASILLPLIVQGLTLQVSKHPRTPPACLLQSPACSSLETPPRVTPKVTMAPGLAGRTQKWTYTRTNSSEPASSSSEPPICSSTCTGAGQAMDPRECYNATAYLQHSRTHQEHLLLKVQSKRS
jgi:hypothetical protein